MSSRHLRTLAAVFEDPVRANILWSDVEAMFMYLGARLKEGSGSRVRVTLNQKRAVYHRPHPQKETPPRTVRPLRMFLTKAGVKP